MALTLERVLAVKQRCRQDSRKPGVTENLRALWKHFEHSQDFEFLHSMFQTFVRRAADFLIRYTEPETGLPLPSYDLWEEHRGIFTYTTAATCAGLRAASRISSALSGG